MNPKLQEIATSLILSYNPSDIAFALAVACRHRATLDSEFPTQEGGPRAWRAVATEFERVKGKSINVQAVDQIPFPYLLKPKNENEIVALLSELWLDRTDCEIAAEQGPKVLMADLIQLIASKTGCATVDRTDPNQPVLTLVRLKD